MQTITLEEAQNHLAEIIDTLVPGEEVILTRANRPVARILAEPDQPPSPVPGRGKGMLRIVSEDNEHLIHVPGESDRSSSPLPAGALVST